MNNIYKLNIKQNKIQLDEADKKILSDKAIKLYEFLNPPKGHFSFRLLRVQRQLNFKYNEMSKAFIELCKNKIITNFSLE